MGLPEHGLLEERVAQGSVHRPSFVIDKLKGATT